MYVSQIHSAYYKIVKFASSQTIVLYVESVLSHLTLLETLYYPQGQVHQQQTQLFHVC